MPKSTGRFAQLVSWSFSVYQQYLKCPFSVCLDKIQRVRIQEPEQPNLVHGNAAHDNAAGFISGKVKKPAKITTPVPGRPALVTDMAVVKDTLVQLRTAKARSEQEWAFDRQYNPVPWFDDWKNPKAPRVWLRIKTDACADTLKPPTVTIVDWKTGRVHDEHKQQRSLYALGGLRLVELGMLAGGSKATTLTAQHVYLDTGQHATEEFKFKDLKSLTREWEARVKDMMNDTVFVTKTGPHCRWCKFRRSNGGPCPERM